MAKQIDTISRKNSNADFFEDIKSELGLASSKKVILIVKKVFGDVQRSLSVTEIKTMMATLPDYLVLMFPGELPQDKSHLSYDHLDQWVESLSSEDQSSPERIFYSEINILKTLVVILTKLDRLCGLLNFSGFKYSLVRELKQASM